LRHDIGPPGARTRGAEQLALAVWIWLRFLMTADELLRRLRRHRDVRVIPSRGKGGHVRVERENHVTHVPTGSGDLKTGLLHGILRQLGLTIEDLR